MKWPSIKLQFKLGIVLSGMLILAASLLSYTLHYRMKEKLSDDIDLHVEKFTSQITQAMEGDTLDSPEGRKRFQDILNHFLRFNLHMDRIYLLRKDKNENLYCAISANKAGSSPTTLDMVPSYIRKNFDDLQRTHMDPYRDPGMDTNLWLLHLPLLSPEGKRLGVVGISIASYWNAFEDLFYSTLLLFLSTVGFALLLSWFFGKRLTKPIVALKVAAERIAQGKLDYRLQVRSRDEIGELTAAFNTMAQQLQESHEQLEGEIAERRRAEVALAGNKEELEKQVEKRTEELKNINAHLEQEITERQDAVRAMRESEVRYRVLVELAPEAVAVQVDDAMVYINPVVLLLLGAEDHNQVMGKAIHDFAHEAYRELIQEKMQTIVQRGGKMDPFQAKLRRFDGSSVNVDIHAGCIVFEDKIGVLITLQDITAHKMAEQALREERDYTAKIIQASPSIICGVDTNGNTTFLNPAGERVTGYSAQELRGKNWWKTLYPGYEYQQVDKLFADLGKVDVSDYEMILTSKDGKKRRVAWNNMMRYTESGEVIEIVGFGNDITERKRAEDELRLLSQRDGLTGLINRRTFDQALQKEWRRCMRAKAPLSLVMIDIDYFKPFNDNYGHQKGDDILKRVAAVLRVSLKRPGDVMARYGGEEFVAILPETNTGGAVQIAEDLRSWTEKLGIPHAYSQAAETVTISLGVSTLIPMQGLMPKHLILAADNALYQSKRQGRNRVSVMAADAEKTGNEVIS